ncbi:hypothetical protein H8E77_24885 [bacterium]|nr:hypothetical protein [bacterium]
MASALLFLLLGLSILAYIAYPLLRKSQGRLEKVSDGSEIELAEEHNRVYNALEDLEFEYECGKISDDDYQQLRQEFLSKVEADSMTSEPIGDLRSTTTGQQLKNSVEAEIARYKSQRKG